MTSIEIKSGLLKAAVILLLSCWSLTGYTQLTESIVSFTDKRGSPYSLDRPGEFLSQKAINRRQRYGIPIDSTDLPVNPAYIQQILSMPGVVYRNQSRWMNQIMISCDDSSVINTIRQLPFVRSMSAVDLINPAMKGPERFKEKVFSPEVEYSRTEITGSDSLAYGAGAAQIQLHNGEFLHEKGYRGAGITIAFLDAGFYHYKELRAFDSVERNGHIVAVKDFVSDDSSVDEDNAHGMYCLSTVAANVPGEMVGSAPGASFILLRSENDASELPVEEQNWAAAAEYADSAGADMISSSLGYFHFDDSTLNHRYNDFYTDGTIVSQAAAMAVKKGMIVMNSAGNEGNSPWRYILFPADADSVCAVGAIDASGRIAAFSSIGYPGRVKPDIVSTGVNTSIWGTNDQPAVGSGTSFSNPNIAGLIACLWEAFPEYANMTILQAVYESANRYRAPDSVYGYGIPDMKQAYVILKKRENTDLYGSDWLSAFPDPFTDSIGVHFVSQLEGPVYIQLRDASGFILSSILMSGEEQESYDTAFYGLSGLPPATYFIQYSDGTTTKTVTVSKLTGAREEWLVVAPVPFRDAFSVYLVAPETGHIILRLMDANGRTLEKRELNTKQGMLYTTGWSTASKLPVGTYFIQYQGVITKTIKLVK